MKRITAIILVALMVFSLAGCSKGNGNDSGNNDSNIGNDSGNNGSNIGNDSSNNGGNNGDGSGSNNGNSEEGSSSSEAEASKYTDALGVLNTVLEVYTEDQKFAIAGGDSGNMTMDAPGAFDVAKTDELDYTLGLPASLAASIDDAASMVHMMNANTFTGAAYHLTEGTDLNTFADTVKENILARQWMCGFPDTLLIIDVDGEYVITAFGEAEIMETFKTNALSALSDANVVVETPIE